MSNLGDAWIEIEPDLGGFDSALTSGVEKAALEAAAAAEDAFRGMGEFLATMAERADFGGLTSEAAQAADEMADRFAAMGEAITEDLPDDVFGPIAASAAEAASAAVDALAGVRSEAQETAGSVVDSFADTAGGVSDALSDVDAGGLRNLSDTARSESAEVVDAFGDVPGSVASIFGEAGRGAGAALRGGLGSLNGISSFIGDKLGRSLDEAIGEYLVRGLDQVKSALSSLTDEAVMAAADVGESLNVVGLQFDTQSQRIIDWAENSADSLGLARSAALDFAGGIGGQLQNLGFAEEAAADYSMSLQTLSADLASAFNKDPSDAVTALQASLRGSFETIEQFNVFLTAEAVAQEAVNSGLAQSTADVSAYAKAQATLNLIQRQTNVVQGDFANTANSLPNLLRRVRAGFADMQAVVGEPALAELTPVVQDLMGVLTDGEDDFRGFGEGVAEFIANAGGPFVDFVERSIDLLPAAGRALGNAGSVVGELADTGAELLPVLETIFDVFSALPPDVLATVVQVVALRSAFGGTGAGIGLMLGPLGAAVPLLSTLGDVLENLPTGLLTAGTTALVARNGLSGLSDSLVKLDKNGRPIEGLLRNRIAGGIGSLTPALAVGAAAFSAYADMMGKARDEGEAFADSVETEFARALNAGEADYSEAVRSLSEKISLLDSEVDDSFLGRNWYNKDLNESLGASREELERFLPVLDANQRAAAGLAGEYGLTADQVANIARVFDVDLAQATDTFEEEVRGALDLVTAGATDTQVAISAVEEAMSRVGRGITAGEVLDALSLDPSAAMANAQLIADTLEIPIGEVKEALEGAAGAIDAFVQNAAQQLPSVGTLLQSAFDVSVSEEGKFQLDTFMATLLEEQAILARFHEDLAEISATSDEVAGAIAAIGPKGASALADELANAGPDAIREVEGLVDDIETESERLVKFYEDELGPAVARGFLEALGGFQEAVDAAVSDVQLPDQLPTWQTSMPVEVKLDMLALEARENGGAIVGELNTAVRAAAEETGPDTGAAISSLLMGGVAAEGEDGAPSAGQDVVSILLGAVGDEADSEAPGSGRSIAASVLGGVGSMGPDARRQGQVFGLDLAGAIDSDGPLGRARSAGGSVAAAGVGGMGGVRGEAESTGRDVGFGFADGMTSDEVFRRIGGAILAVRDSVVGLFSSTFKIQSPSKVTEEMGGYLIQGLVQGMEREAASSSVARTASAVLDGFNLDLTAPALAGAGARATAPGATAARGPLFGDGAIRIDARGMSPHGLVAALHDDMSFYLTGRDDL